MRRDGYSREGLPVDIGRYFPINAKDCEKVNESGAVDDAKTEQFVDAGDGVLVLELRQPGIRDVKLVVTSGFREPAANVLDFSGGDTKAIAQFPQLVSGTRYGCH